MGLTIDTPQGMFEYDGKTMADTLSKTVFLNTQTVAGQILALKRSTAVQTAVTHRVNAFTSFKLWAQDANENRVMNTTVTADLKKMQRFNQIQYQKDFLAQMETYCLVFGKAFIWTIERSVGFPDTAEHYLIPNGIANPVYSGSAGRDSLFQYKLDYLSVSLPSGELRLPADEVTIIYDNYIGMSGYGFGESRLSALSEQISTLQSSAEVTTQLIDDGGARGVLSMGGKDINMITAPFIDDEKDAIQEELSKYGNKRGQLRYIVTKGAATYTPITAKLTDMDLTARNLDATVQIYNRFGLPSIYAAKEPRFQAMPEARKVLYTDAVIPESLPKYEALFRLKKIPEREWSYLPDVSHMDFFQESLRKGAIAVQQVINGVLPAVESGLLTKEEARRVIEPYI